MKNNQKKQKKINLQRQKFALTKLNDAKGIALEKALEEVGIYPKPFPKRNPNWLSYYRYKPQELSIIPGSGYKETTYRTT